ncbi:MAG: hypothetical protein WDA21_00435 [Bacilli bacterium]
MANDVFVFMDNVFGWRLSKKDLMKIAKGITHLSRRNQQIICDRRPAVFSLLTNCQNIDKDILREALKSTPGLVAFASNHLELSNREIIGCLNRLKFPYFQLFYPEVFNGVMFDVYYKRVTNKWRIDRYGSSRYDSALDLKTSDLLELAQRLTLDDFTEEELIERKKGVLEAFFEDKFWQKEIRKNLGIEKSWRPVPREVQNLYWLNAIVSQKFIPPKDDSILKNKLFFYEVAELISSADSCHYTAGGGYKSSFKERKEIQEREKDYLSVVYREEAMPEFIGCYLAGCDLHLWDKSMKIPDLPFFEQAIKQIRVGIVSQDSNDKNKINQKK